MLTITPDSLTRQMNGWALSFPTLILTSDSLRELGKLVCSFHSSEESVTTYLRSSGCTFLSVRLASRVDPSGTVTSAASSHPGLRRADVWRVMYDNTIQINWPGSEFSESAELHWRYTSKACFLAAFHPLKPVVRADTSHPEYGMLSGMSGYKPLWDIDPGFGGKGWRGAVSDAIYSLAGASKLIPFSLEVRFRANLITLAPLAPPGD